MALVISGTFVDLSHLAGGTYSVDVPLRGNQVKKMTVELAYTNHCYSRGPLVGEEVPTGFVVMDGAKARIFDWRRYHLSKNLPHVMASLFSGDATVRATHHHNFVQIELVEELADGIKREVNYYIFLRIRKHDVPNEPKLMKIRVETAFPEDLLYYDKPELGKPYSLKKILQCYWEGRDYWRPDPGSNSKKKGKNKR
ncbi:hypothetical protein [Cupriavidus sp. D39]|uniref:hypothetical protein n=1 Tax=Cupriavidus sp. D39 TaxID=2997877 RepID=UPI00226E23F8|nr:hypothetical protein [Cupriavidus sp. D39]MCY0854048.1 hypothetical protein [Cupriavidus sp. D39]